MNNDPRNYTGSYYNTSNVRGETLTHYENIATSQEQKILDWFKTYEQTASPSQLQHVLRKAPITSIRRALTNLTNAGDLVKTDKQVLGPYRRPEYVWKLAPKHDQREFELVQ